MVVRSSGSLSLFNFVKSFSSVYISSSSSSCCWWPPVPWSSSSSRRSLTTSAAPQVKKERSSRKPREDPSLRLELTRTSHKLKLQKLKLVHNKVEANKRIGSRNPYNNNYNKVTNLVPLSPSDSTPTTREIPSAGGDGEIKKKARSGSAEAALSYILKSAGPSVLAQLGLDSTTTKKEDEGKTRTDLKLALPKQCFRLATTIPTTAFLVDKKVAEQIAQLFREDVEASHLNRLPFVEFGSGLGLVTSELVASGWRGFTCFEENAKLVKVFREKKEFADAELNLVEKYFAEFPKLHHADKLDGGSRISDFLAQIKVNPAAEDPNRKHNLLVLGTFFHVSLSNFLIRSFATNRIFFDGEWSWDDPVFYAAVGSKAYWILTAKPDSGYFVYRTSSILFQLFFKCKVLTQLPRQAWLPWSNETQVGKSNHYKARNAYNPEVVYFVKIETNHELLKEIGKDNLIQLFYFVRQHLFSRRNYVIAGLEQWIPGCGSRLIREGFTIYSRFGELTPTEILQLFRQFTKWPEFSNCSFSAAVEKFQSRLDLHEDDEH